MEGKNLAVAAGGEQAPVQLSIWDLIEADPAPVEQPTDHNPAAEAGAPEQQPAADPVIAHTRDLEEAAGPRVGSIDGSPADGPPPDAAPVEHTKEDSDPESVPDPIPPRGSIRIRTGREAMQSRAVRLHGEIGKLAKLTPMDLRTEGDPIPVDSKTVSKLRSTYMANDGAIQEDRKDHSAGDRVAARREHRHAWDRARQEIDRAFDDLVNIYAADEVVDPETGKRTGYQVYRLPEVRRRQLDHGAESVLPRPGGGRIMVDAAGIEVGRQCPERPGDEHMLLRPESQLQEISDRTDG